MNTEDSPAWATITSASLLGWNIGLVSAFFLAIAVGVISKSFNLSISSNFSITIILLLSVCLGITLGIYAGRKAAKWFKKQSRVKSYIWLILLVLITLLSFPAPFNYVIVK